MVPFRAWAPQGLAGPCRALERSARPGFPLSDVAGGFQDPDAGVEGLMGASWGPYEGRVDAL